MALATLQDALVPGVSPPWRLSLTYSSELKSSLPQERLFPQFIKSAVTPHPALDDANPQTLFRIFRNAGPLVSVRVGVNVGYPQPSAVVEYWNEEHANYARKQKQSLHETTRDSPPFLLRTFDPCNLYCAVSKFNRIATIYCSTRVCKNLESTYQLEDMKGIFSKV